MHTDNIILCTRTGRTKVPHPQKLKILRLSYRDYEIIVSYIQRNKREVENSCGEKEIIKNYTANLSKNQTEFPEKKH